MMNTDDIPRRAGRVMMNTDDIPRRAVARVMGLVVVVACAAGCGISPSDAPNAVPAEQQADFAVVEVGDAAAGSSRIYLLAPVDPDEPQRLRSVSRDLPGDPDSLLTSLFSGPNEDEQEIGLSTVLPREVELVDTRTIGGVLTVDITDGLSELTPDALRIAVGQIVITANEIEGINAVRLRVDGVDQLWPVAGGELTDDTLTVYDYPGLVESTQPPLPGLPGGGEA